MATNLEIAFQLSANHSRNWDFLLVKGNFGGLQKHIGYPIAANPFYAKFIFMLEALRIGLGVLQENGTCFDLINTKSWKLLVRVGILAPNFLE